MIGSQQKISALPYMRAAMNAILVAYYFIIRLTLLDLIVFKLDFYFCNTCS